MLYQIFIGITKILLTSKRYESKLLIIMSGTLNKVMLIGHLGDDIKMHYFDGGGSIGRFPLATNESYVNKNTGEKVSNTEWHNLVVRNKAAEICEKYLSKGDRIYVEGRIKTRKWTGEDGADRYSTEINVNEFTFLTTKKDVSQTSPSDSVPNTNSEAVPLEKDDLPF